MIHAVLVLLITTPVGYSPEESSLPEYVLGVWEIESKTWTDGERVKVTRKFEQPFFLVVRGDRYLTASITAANQIFILDNLPISAWTRNGRQVLCITRPRIKNDRVRRIRSRISFEYDNRTGGLEATAEFNISLPNGHSQVSTSRYSLSRTDEELSGRIEALLLQEIGNSEAGDEQRSTKSE